MKKNMIEQEVIQKLLKFDFDKTVSQYSSTQYALQTTDDLLKFSKTFYDIGKNMSIKGQNLSVTKDFKHNKNVRSAIVTHNNNHSLIAGFVSGVLGTPLTFVESSLLLGPDKKPTTLARSEYRLDIEGMELSFYIVHRAIPQNRYRKECINEMNKNFLLDSITELYEHQLKHEDAEVHYYDDHEDYIKAARGKKAPNGKDIVTHHVAPSTNIISDDDEVEVDKPTKLGHESIDQSSHHRFLERKEKQQEKQQQDQEQYSDQTPVASSLLAITRGPNSSSSTGKKRKHPDSAPSSFILASFNKHPQNSKVQPHTDSAYNKPYDTNALDTTSTVGFNFKKTPLQFSLNSSLFLSFKGTGALNKTKDNKENTDKNTESTKIPGSTNN